MLGAPDLEYFAIRIDEEFKRAAEAVSPEARAAHAELAERYRRRLSAIERQKNDIAA